MGTERATSTYSNALSERFRMSGVPYVNQYFTFSMEKLETLRPCFRPLIKRRWPDTVFADEAEGDIAESYVYADSIKDAKERCVVIATLFKDMKLRPSALETYAKDIQAKKPIAAKYTSEDDSLFIEDKTVRMPIVGSHGINPQLMVTGVVICLKGLLNQQGELEVEDYLLPGPPLDIPFSPSSEEKYVAFVSGLEIAEANVNHSNLLLLKDFFWGNTPLVELSQKITRLIVAGNGLGSCDVKSLVDCDVYFSQLASCVNIDLMPGCSDPTNLNLPQQPIIPCFFEHSRRYGTFQSTTNPYFFTVDGTRFLGTSGQAVKGICDYSLLSELDALKLSIKSRFIAPTAPDTLACHPEARGLALEKDEEFPHVVFSGNCTEFSSCFVGDNGAPPLALCIPKFTLQPSIVLVSLSTLQPRLIKLS